MRQNVGKSGLYRPSDVEFRGHHEGNVGAPALPREQQGFGPGFGSRDQDFSIFALPGDRQLSGVGVGVAGGQQGTIGRVDDKVDERQLVIVGDRLVIDPGLGPVARQDRIAEVFPSSVISIGEEPGRSRIKVYVPEVVGTN